MPRQLTRPRPEARAIAHDVLVRVETEQAFADVLLRHRLTGDLPANERALASELVYGTLTWQGRLDHHLTGLLHEPLARLEPPVRVALRLGLYQLLFLDRVPAYAAVDATVRLAPRRASGLVNAVLRRAARAGREGLPLPDGDRLDRLAVEWSHPRWLVERWARELGETEAAAFLRADTQAPEVAIRANIRRTSREALQTALQGEGIETRPGRFAPHALVVMDGAARLRASSAWQSGLFAFQGEASQLVAAMVDVPPDAHVLDACAAPGGKTLAVAERLSDAGRIIACDPKRVGLARLRAEATRLGLVPPMTVVADARRLPFDDGFDAVIVDAPCSGLGTLRRHPELKWRRRPDDVPRLAALQRDILDGVAGRIRPGGLLVYAVCTRTQDETTDVIQGFLASHPRFVVEPPEHVATDPDGMLRTAPHTHGLDGFFAARLRAERA